MAMKRLIVEDNAPVHRMIRRVVGSLADEVYECENGETALAAYQAHNRDVVLMAWDA
jgi:CheY-like chemotaxis protein